MTLPRRADEQDADRRQAHALDRAGAEAQAEHHRRREDEQDVALVRRQQVAGDAADPRVGAEFDGAEGGERYNTNSRLTVVLLLPLRPRLHATTNYC